MTSSDDVRGIEVLLHKLRRAPDSAMMRERILSLLADLPDSDEKVRLTVELADVVRKGNPMAGLRIAYMAHQYDRTSIAALTAIEESLRRLGRDDGVERIQDEIKRLRQRAQAAERPKVDPAEARAPEHTMNASFESVVPPILPDDATVVLTPQESKKVSAREPNLKDSSERIPASDKSKLSGLRVVKEPDATRGLEKAAPAARSTGEKPPEKPISVFVEVDQLMKAGDFFVAMVRMRQVMTDHLSNENALSGLERLQVIWAKLGLRGFVWKPSEGLEVFLRKVRKAPLPTASALAAGVGEAEE